MHQVDVEIKNPNTRLGYEIVRIAEQSFSEVEIYKSTVKINAKSILGVYSLGIREGDMLYFKSWDQEVLRKIKVLCGSN